MVPEYRLVLPRALRFGRGAIAGLPDLDAGRFRRITAEGANALARYRQLAVIATGNSVAEPDDLGVWLAETVTEAGIERPVLNPKDCDETIALVASASSTRGNPIVLSDIQLTSILEAVVARDGVYD